MTKVVDAELRLKTVDCLRFINGHEPSVIAEDVESVDCGMKALRKCRYRRKISEIECHRFDSSTRGFHSDLVRSFCGLGFVATGHDDASASTCEVGRDVESESGIRTGDDSDLSGEVRDIGGSPSHCVALRCVDDEAVPQASRNCSRIRASSTGWSPWMLWPACST